MAIAKTARKTAKKKKNAGAPPRKTARVRSVRSATDKVTNYTKPMLATIQQEAFDDKDWIFEIKWDGYRAIAETGKDLRLYSRNGLSFLRLYPAVADALRKISEEAVLDGEIVVLNEENKPDFQRLQQYDSNPSLPIIYYVFDCLSYQGKSIADRPLIERKEIARKVLAKSKIVRYSDHVGEHGIEFFSKVRERDLEGMIAKRASSVYQPGKRSRDWLKIKNHNTQEAVIAGYTAPKGSREYFGALILGIFEGKRLQYIGHTGTGFTSAILKEVHKTLAPLKRKTSPFEGRVAVNGPVTWVEPSVVCEVKFTEVTEEGIMRHPVFLGLRIDKSAKEATALDPPATSTLPAKTTAIPKAGKKADITVGGHKLTLTNLEKIYWPDDKISKGDLIAYYNAISTFILPLLKGRPQSLRRNPNGIKDKGFFHKDAGGDAPDWVETVSLEAESANRKIEYILCNDTATLLYLNNLGCIELNPWNSRILKPDHPDYLVIDLDPSDDDSFDQVIEAALAVKSILDEAGAPGYCKTSGATGLHVYVPLNAQYTHEEVRGFAELIATLTQQLLPDTTTTERSLSKRKGRLYVDYLQNKKGQTLASVYSVRPRPGATVSTPLQWKEVKKGLHPSQFNIFNAEKRIHKVGDLFSGVLTEKIDLKKSLKNLQSRYKINTD